MPAVDEGDVFDYYRLLLRVAGEAAGLLRDFHAREEYRKPIRGDTIKADLEAESYIIDILRYEGFRGRIVTEERGVVKLGSSKEVILVDPLDGSTNYRIGVPWCSVSLALAEGDKLSSVVAGVVVPIFHGDPLGFARGRGCFAGLSRVHPEESRVNLTFVYADTAEALEGVKAIASILRGLGGSLKVRSLGSASLEIAYTALGKARLFADLRRVLRNVDVAASLGMLRECGGIALTTRGAPLDEDVSEVRVVGPLLASLNRGLLTTVIEKLS